LSYKKGGFVTIRHNQIQNITASLLKEVCKDVNTEPSLLQLSGESFNERTANKTDGARLDIGARDFWTSGQKAFFNVRVFKDTKIQNSRSVTLSTRKRRKGHITREF